MSRIFIGFAVLVAIMLAIPLLLAWSAGRRRVRVGRSRGTVELRMPRGHYAILASIAILPCFGFAGTALAAAWAPGAEWNGPILALFMGGLGVAGGGYLLALELRYRIRVDEVAVEKTGAFRRRRAGWNEVAKVTHNPVNRWFFLTLASGQRVYVSEGMDGIADFAELALAHLPPAVLAASPDAEEALRDLSTC